MTQRIIYLIFTAQILMSSACNDDNPTSPDDTFDIIKYGFFYDNPAWHPDGKWIAAEHGDSIDTDFDGIADTAFSGIWIINAETGYKQPLIRGFGAPAWSSDGKKLAMDGGGQIFSVEISSLEPARIDSGSILQLIFEGRNFWPAWSPDGNWIAYDNTNCGSSVKPAPPESCGIIFIRANGLEKKFFTRGRMPDWSPDGADLIFIALETNIFRLSIVDTSNIIQLTSTVNTDYNNPIYSPDGREIAIHLQPRAGGPPSLWIMESDGSGLRQLTEGPDRQFDWSPDGKQIVFLRWSPNEPIEGNGQLWVINTDGTNLRQLTFNQ